MSERDVALATFTNETEAMMCADLLRSEGILSILVPLGSGAAGWGASVWRPFALRVREADAERARLVLAVLEGEQDEEDEGDDEADDEADQKDR